MNTINIFIVFFILFFVSAEDVNAKATFFQNKQNGVILNSAINKPFCFNLKGWVYE